MSVTPCRLATITFGRDSSAWPTQRRPLPFPQLVQWSVQNQRLHGTEKNTERNIAPERIRSVEKNYDYNCVIVKTKEHPNGWALGAIDPMFESLDSVKHQTRTMVDYYDLIMRALEYKSDGPLD